MRFGTFGPIMMEMEKGLILLFALNVLVVSAFAIHLALRRTVTLGTSAPEAPAGSAETALTMPDGRTLEEYVYAGLVDLRIMLVQAARRSH